MAEEPQKKKKKVTTEKYIAKLRKRHRKAAEAVLEALPTKFPQFLERHDKFVAQFATPADVRAAMAEQATQALASGGASNCHVTGLLETVQDDLLAILADLAVLSRFIVINQPNIEDGGNFGAGVQAEVLKYVATLEKALETELATLPGYYKDRAGAMKECVTKSKTTSSTSKNGSNETTGGEKPGTTGTKSTSEDTSTTTTAGGLPDHIRHIAQLDAKWWFSLVGTHRSALEGYVAICDSITKNREKTWHPRGTGGGGGFNYN